MYKYLLALGNNLGNARIIIESSSICCALCHIHFVVTNEYSFYTNKKLVRASAWTSQKPVDYRIRKLPSRASVYTSSSGTKSVPGLTAAIASARADTRSAVVAAYIRSTSGASFSRESPAASSAPWAMTASGSYRDSVTP